MTAKAAASAPPLFIPEQSPIYSGNQAGDRIRQFPSERIAKVHNVTLRMAGKQRSKFTRLCILSVSVFYRRQIERERERELSIVEKI